MRWTGFAIATALLCGGVTWAAPNVPQAAKPAAEPKYLGSAKCKNCHSSEKTGDQHGKWKSLNHSHAFATLATPEAIKVAKAKGIDDPQKSEQCVRCHVTGHGLPPERFAKGFDPKEGVQCETCHGPGEKHLKARMAAAMSAPDDANVAAGAVPALVKLPDGEIKARPEMKDCTACHNEESPTFKPFCYKHRLEKISHPDPRVTERKPDPDAEKCTCPDKPAGN